MPGAVDYALPGDVLAYLPNVNQTEESAIWTSLITVVSRDVDRYCDRYFYSDGVATKYFDGDGTAKFYSARHDFYSLTALKVARFENADPASTTDWVTFTGDGVVPPSNFFLEPANLIYAGRAGSAAKKPFFRIELPVTPIASSATNWLSTFTQGKRTISIAATWGWPVVPDEIKDLVCKVVIRMWKARDAGFTGAVGSPDVGSGALERYLDINDLMTLAQYRRRVAG